MPKGKPKATVQFRIDPALLKKIDAKAKAEMRTRSEVIQIACMQLFSRKMK